MLEQPEGERPFPHELRLPLAPYEFVWSHEAAVDCRARSTPSFSEELYTFADGTVVVIRNYIADGSFHIMSDRGEIRLVDHAADHRSAHTVSLVRLP